MVPVVRTARLAEVFLLQELQRRASLHWPTYREQLLADPGAIELPFQEVRDGLVRVAVDGWIVGFSVLLPETGGACQLDGLFVEPERMGEGVGRLLVEDSAQIARGQGATVIEVVANPDARDFYEGVGFLRGEEVATRFGVGHRMRLWAGRSTRAGHD
jgi:GNAT superfamily N-acetyltransferase